MARIRKGSLARAASLWSRCVVLVGVLTPDLSAAQIVRGKVIERTSGLPVPAVGVLLLDESGRVRMAARSDSSGNYSMQAPAGGRYRLNFSRTGMKDLDGIEASVNANSTTVVDAVLELGPTVLTDMKIRAKPTMMAPPGNPTKYDEFLRRKAIGMGTFLTREDIDSRPRTRVQDIFNALPGVKVRENGTKWYLRSQRCSGKSIPGFNITRPKQEPMVFIDGVRVSGGPLPEDLSALAQISAASIEAIEVYQGAAQLPAEARGDSCFAVFIWLR